MNDVTLLPGHSPAWRKGREGKAMGGKEGEKEKEAEEIGMG